MFSRKHLALIGIVFAAVANGFPAEVAEHLHPSSPKRSLGNVYFCANDGWTAPCDVFGVDDNICCNVPDDFNDNINSFGPDEGIGCILYECVDSTGLSRHMGTAHLIFFAHRDSDCVGISLFLAYPGSSQLDRMDFGNVTSSFKCMPFS